MTTTAHTTALATELRYLALGDSYTIGEGIDEAGRWPVQLARALRAGGVPLADPRIIATTGWTTDELDAAITAQEPLGGHDFVSLLIGVNNQYRGRNLDEYAGQFEALLRRAIGFAGERAGRVLVLSIPDWGVTPFARRQGRDAQATAQAIDAFNATARQACRRQHVAFVDITPASRAHGGQAAMLADDGLHPSAAMYALWTAQALPVARALLHDAPAP
ncbi:SGNH/GDSL hydrolase family protein [Pseudoxanthomonas mexicana]|uniref:SGNH/GDSL hydrolase family protein n=1 Tax=Pseudoxanthomonas mexicana TaxID=128785 RepID=UPI00398B7EF8